MSSRPKTKSVYAEVLSDLKLTVLWTTLLSDDSIPIALPTADDPSPTDLSVSVLAPSTGEESKHICRRWFTLKMAQYN